jgi:hypothetical protein
MEEYGFNKEEVINNVLSNRHNHVTTTYYLLLKSKVKKGQSSIADLSSKEFIEFIKNPENLLAFYNNNIESVIKHRGGIEKKVSEKETKLDTKDSDNNLKRFDTLTTSNNSKLSGLTHEERPKTTNTKKTDRRSSQNSNNSYLNTEIIDKIHSDIKKLPNVAYHLKTENKEKDKFKKIPISMQYAQDANRANTKKRIRPITDFKSNFVNTSNSFDHNSDIKNITIDQGMLKKIANDKAQKSPRVNFIKK